VKLHTGSTETKRVSRVRTDEQSVCCIPSGCIIDTAETAPVGDNADLVNSNTWLRVAPVQQFPELIFQLSCSTGSLETKV
jgi:hypothetical protein